MPQVQVLFFRDHSGFVPALEWLDGLPEKARDKFIVRIERLADKGSELKRPEADILRDGIYELRVRHMRVNYRMLYFFHGKTAVLSHGLQKEDRVPEVDIDRALIRKRLFRTDQARHVYEE